MPTESQFVSSERLPLTVPNYFLLLGKQILLPGHSHISQCLPVLCTSPQFVCRVSSIDLLIRLCVVRSVGNHCLCMGRWVVQRLDLDDREWHLHHDERCWVMMRGLDGFTFLNSNMYFLSAILFQRQHTQSRHPTADGSKRNCWKAVVSSQQATTKWTGFFCTTWTKRTNQVNKGL